MATFSLWSHITFPLLKCRERTLRHLFLFLDRCQSYRISLNLMTPFSLHCLLKSPSLSTVSLGVRTLPYELGVGTHNSIHSTLLDSLSFSSKLLGNPPGIGCVIGPTLHPSFFISTPFAMSFYISPHQNGRVDSLPFDLGLNRVTCIGQQNGAEAGASQPQAQILNELPNFHLPS